MPKVLRMYYTSHMMFPEVIAVDSSRKLKEFKKNFCAKNKSVILTKYKASVIEKYSEGYLWY